MSRPGFVDPRGPRVGAMLTTAVLAVALLTRSVPLLAVQGVVFAVGAVLGLRAAPYGLVFRAARRVLSLGPPAELEAEGPPRFAQAVGAAFAAAALLLRAAGLDAGFDVAVSLALAAAFLNAAFGFCLGCEVYLLLARVRGAVVPPRVAAATEGS